MKQRLAWFGFGFFLVTIVSLTLLWFNRETLESRLFDALIKKISPSLPFKIESYHIGRNLESLSMTIHFHDESIKFSGPLEWKWLEKKAIELRYHPLVSILGASDFPLSLQVQTNQSLSEIENLEFDISKSDFNWSKFGIVSKSISLKSEYHKDSLHLSFGFGSVLWNDPSASNHTVSLGQISVQVKIPNVKAPMNINLNAHALGTEVLWDKNYLDLNLAHLPLRLDVQDGKEFAINLGNSLLKSHIKLDHSLPNFNDAHFSLKTNPISLPDSMPWIAQNLAQWVPQLKSIKDYEIKKGKISLEGNGNYQRDKNNFSLHQFSGKSEGLSFQSTKKKLTVKDLDFDFSYEEKKIDQIVHLQIRDIYFRHFSGNLKPITLLWNQNAFWTTTDFPLQIKDIPLTFGKITAKLKPEFNLLSSMHLAPTEVSTLLKNLCLPENKTPPISLKADLPEIQISSNDIDPTGKVIASLFGGSIELDELMISNLDTEVPETSLDLRWSGINLEKLGAWSKLGEIKGTLEGYAHDVVLQALLPTHYHFLFNIAPYDQVHTTGRVEFSPEAMKNVVKIFTGTDLDQQIPGVAGWLMFGWPSHVFGGYDVYYAGLKLTSEEGHIIVETLDKPGILEKEHKHFVLYGPRFKMPLKNLTYPLIIDATSMSNFVHQLWMQMLSIQQQKEGTQTNEIPEIQCNPPEI